MSLLFKNIVGNQMKKYKTTVWREDPIEEVEVEKETPNFVWIKGWRYKKESEHHYYANTREEAINYLIKQKIDELTQLKIKTKRVELRIHQLEVLGNLSPFIDRKE